MSRRGSLRFAYTVLYTSVLCRKNVKWRMIMGVESIPANLLRYRKAQGVTQVQLAKDIGISRQAYYAIEAGRSVPKSGTLVAIAQALDSSLPDILADPPSFSSLRFRSGRSTSSRMSRLMTSSVFSSQLEQRYSPVTSRSRRCSGFQLDAATTDRQLL